MTEKRIPLAVALLVGILTALPSRINAELAARIGDGYLAALISFGSGLVLLLVILTFWAPGRRGFRRVVAALASRRVPWWYVCGGLAGAFFVLSQGLTAGTLGVALFTIGLYAGGVIGASFIGLAIVVVKRTGVLLLGLGGIAGQLTTALILDIIAPVAERPISTTTIVGAVVTVLAVAIAAIPSARIGRGRTVNAIPEEPLA